MAIERMSMSLPLAHVSITRRLGRGALQPGAHDFGEERVELVGGFVLHPVARTRDDLKTGFGLERAQGSGAFVEVRIGGGVAPAPDAVEPRGDQGQCRTSVSAREKRRLRTRPRGAFSDWI